MMSKAKWFAVKKPEIIATSANQIVPARNSVDLQKCCTRGSGDETTYH